LLPSDSSAGACAAAPVIIVMTRRSPQSLFIRRIEEWNVARAIVGRAEARPSEIRVLANATSSPARPGRLC
jgi:hypothetical protein